MRLLIAVCCSLCLGVAASQATLIDVVTASNTDETSPVTGSFGPKGYVSTDGGATTGGIFRVTDQVFTGDTSPTTLGYTLSGLTIDGVGTANDSVVVSFTVSNDGQLFDVVDSATGEPQNAGWISSGGATLNADGEFVLFAFNSLSVNLNGGTGNGSGTFDGFTQARVGAFGAGDAIVVNGTLLVNGVDSNTLDLTPGGNDMTLLYLHDAAAGASGTPRPQDWSFQITAIPEPTTLATLLVFGSALVLSRKRRTR